jgi:predicted dehydrogenase
VIVATNEHWHVLPAIHACAAGKDVYLEKPVGTSILEGRALINAARRYDRIVQMGTQQHSWEHYQQAVELIRAGAIGAVSQVHVWDVENQSPGIGSPPDEPAPAELDWDFWLGPSPSVAYNRNRYAHEDWFFDYGGGWQVAWGAHHFDIVHWAMGVTGPVSATGSGGKFAFPGDNRQWPDTFEGTCQYPAGPVAENGFLLTYTAPAGLNGHQVRCLGVASLKAKILCAPY